MIVCMPSLTIHSYSIGIYAFFRKNIIAAIRIYDGDYISAIIITALPWA